MVERVENGQLVSPEDNRGYALMRADNIPNVSVIIPAYCAASTIGRAVESVLAQTAPAAEILVIDDGSPDDLGAALVKYGDRVTLIRKPNGGAASARNLGIERAQGDFIAFLDADDYWAPNKLQRQLILFERHPELGLVAGQFSMQSTVDGQQRAGLKIHAAHFNCVRRLQGAAAFRAANEVWTGTVLVRRAALGGERFLRTLQTAEDRDLWVRLIAKTPIYLCSEPLATAVLEVGSLSRSNVARDFANMLHVVDRHREQLGVCGRWFWRSHTYYRWAGCDDSPRRALAQLTRSLAYWPFPYPRWSVIMPAARAKLLIVTLLRLVGLYRRRGARASQST